MGGLGIIGGRYIIEDLIGQGAMGAVYRGLDTYSDQTVAIKFLKPEIVREDPDFVERFIREGEALRKLNHPNIVKMLDAIEENSSHYIVLEHVSGGTLSDLLRHDGALPVNRILDLALDLADALTRAHRLNIVHRDLKPANVLMAEDGTPRLTDFGHARMGDQSRLTRSGYLVGTYAYLSPEMINGDEIDARADIWAFGVMLYEMLAGVRPFSDSNPAPLLAAIVSKQPTDLRTIRPDVPEELIRLVEWMLEKNPNERIPSVRQVGAILEALHKGGDANALFANIHRTPSSTALKPPISMTTHAQDDSSTDLDPQQQSVHTPILLNTPPSLNKLRDTDQEESPDETQKPRKNRRTSFATGVVMVAVVLISGFLLLSRPATTTSDTPTPNSNILPLGEGTPNSAPAATAVPLAVEPVAEGEVMILVADFEAMEGAAGTNPARFIYEDLVQRLQNNPFSNIRIRRYEAVLTSNAQARQAAENAGAAVVVWGRYFGTNDVEVEVQIGAISIFEDNIFERDLLEETFNVRLTMTDPRRQSIAVAVITELIGLSSADGNVFETNRLTVLLDQMEGETAVIEGSSIASYVHRTFLAYLDDPLTALAAIDNALLLDRRGNALLPLSGVLLRYRVGDSSNARLDIASARALEPEWIVPIFVQASLALDEGRFNDAIGLWTQVVDARPDDWYPLNFRGATYYLMGDYENARVDYERAMALNPEANFPYIPATTIALRRGEIIHAAEIIDTVVERFPDATLSHRMIEPNFRGNTGEIAVFGPAFSSFTNLILRRYERAVSDADIALAINPNLADLHLARGYAYCNLAYSELDAGNQAQADHHFQAALDSYSAGIALEPDYAVLYLLRAEIYIHRGDLAQGLQEAGTITTLNPSSQLLTLMNYGTRGEISCSNFFDDSQRLLTPADATPQAADEN